MPHDGEGGFEARGQCLVHVSLYIGQKVIINVDVVLGQYAVACGVEHTLMPSAWPGTNYSLAAGGGHASDQRSFWRSQSCLATRSGRKKYATASAAMATLNGSQELAEATLPNTPALAAKKIGPTMKPKAPTRSGNILGKRKQDEISRNAKNMSSLG